jgi:hypothetical protein
MSVRASTIAGAAIIGVIGLLVWQRPNMATAQDLEPDQHQGVQDLAVAPQRAVLYEEDPGDPTGRQTPGVAIWRTEEIASPAGEPPELAVRADVEFPGRQIGMTWTLRRAAGDISRSASHTIEIMFKLPPDFPAGGVFSVPGVVVKQAEQVRGVALAAAAVKVTDGYFMVGLSAAPADKARNIELLKNRPWFDIPIIYTNQRRAILAMEKGTPGELAMAQAFADWEK